MKVNSVYEFLNLKYPIETASEFDNPGFLIGNADSDVKKALISLDCTVNTVKKAVDNDCQLIITHHPLIFSGLKKVLSDSVVFKLIENGISVISMHTNLDMGEGGVNDCLCNKLRLENIKPFTAKSGFQIRCADIYPVSAENFAEHLKKFLGGTVKYVGSSHLINKLLICSGSGGEFLQDAIDGGFDALVTADVKHNVFIDAENADIAVFDAGHFNTEDVVVEPLKEMLSAKFPSVEFITVHNSKIKYI